MWFILVYCRKCGHRVGGGWMGVHASNEDVCGSVIVRCRQHPFTCPRFSFGSLGIDGGEDAKSKSRMKNRWIYSDDGPRTALLGYEPSYQEPFSVFECMSTGTTAEVINHQYKHALHRLYWGDPLEN